MSTGSNVAKSQSGDALVQRALSLIENCNDPGELEQIARNAHRLGQDGVRHAAMLRRYAVMPSAKPGTLEYDVWQSIFALEGTLKEERGKTVLLSRTRQKIKKDGEHRTVTDLVLGKVSEGFRMLIDRDMPQLTFEAVALRHLQKFDEAVINAAGERLQSEGVDLQNILPR